MNNKSYLALVAIVLGVIAIGMQFIHVPVKIGTSGTVESNIPLTAGALLVGNDVNYAQEDTTPSIIGNTDITGTLKTTGKIYVATSSLAASTDDVSIYSTGTTTLTIHSGGTTGKAGCIKIRNQLGVWTYCYLYGTTMTCSATACE